MSKDEDVSIAHMAASMGVVKGRKRKSGSRMTGGSVANIPAAVAAAAAEGDAPASKRAKLAEGVVSALNDDEDVAEFQLKLLEDKKVWVTLRDLQQLVLWLVGKEGLMPRWIFVRHKSVIKQVCVVCINSLSLPIWTQNKECFPFLSKAFLRPEGLAASNPDPRNGQLLPTKLCSHTKDVRRNSFLREFFSKDVVKKQREQGPFQRRGAVGSVGDALQALQNKAQKDGDSKDEKKEAGTGATAPAAAHPVPGGGVVTTLPPSLRVRGAAVEIPVIPAAEALASVREDYLANLDCLVEHGFIVTEKSCDAVGFKKTQKRKEGCTMKAADRMLCVDCEMCQTQAGMELARVSVVNWDGDVLYDTLVQPAQPVQDYLTQWSGITEEMLAGVKTTLEDVHTHLLSTLLFEDTVLMGHSLENDLKAMKLVHHTVCDTTILYPHYQGPPLKSALRYLSVKHLNRSIQSTHNDQGHATGHCSVEDAKAALDLIKMKVKFGENFGVPSKRRMESMMKSIDGRCLVAEEPESISFIPSKDARVDIIPIASDVEGAKKISKGVKGQKFKLSFLDLHTLEKYREATEWASTDSDDDSSSSSSSSSSSAADADKSTLREILAKLDDTVQDIYDAAPVNTAFIIMSGQSNGIKEINGEAPDSYMRRWDLNKQGIAMLGIKTAAAAAARKPAGTS